MPVSNQNIRLVLSKFQNSLVEERLESVAEDPEVLGLAAPRLQVVHGLPHVHGAEEVVVDEEAARRGEVLADDVPGGVVETLRRVH